MTGAWRGKMLASALALAIAGCEEAKQPPRIDSVSPQTAASPLPPVAPPSNAASSEASPPGANPPKGSPDDDKAPQSADVPPLGVPECDRYIKKYLECEGRVSSPDREKLQEALEANLVKWRQLAAMKEGKLAAGLACKTAQASSREKLSVDYGCEF